MKRLLVAHRFPVVRHGLIALVEEHIRDVVVAEAGTLDDALRSVREAAWHAAVIGLSFGGRGGLELLKAIKELRPTLAVLVISSHAQEFYARRCFKAGAAGYVMNDSSRFEVVHAIQHVMSGGRYVSSGLVHPPHRGLSDREFEVMRLLAAGKTVSEIALLLSLSDGTVRTYRARVLDRLSSTGAGRSSPQCRSHAR